MAKELHPAVAAELRKQQSITSRMQEELDQAGKIREKLETTIATEARIAKKRAIQAAKVLSTTQLAAEAAKADREAAEQRWTEATEILAKAEKVKEDASRRVKLAEPHIKARMEEADKIKAQAEKLLAEAEEIKIQAVAREKNASGLNIKNKQQANANNEARIQLEVKTKEIKERERVVRHRENTSLEIVKDLDQRDKDLKAWERQVLTKETQLIDAQQDFKMQQLKKK